MNRTFLRRMTAALATALLIGASTDKVKSDTPAARPDLEQLSSVDSIKDAAQHGSPMAIWAVLEHGEQVDCLDCVAYVEPLLYNADAHVREISAWWLRRRTLAYPDIAARARGVLQNDADATRRAYAANAIGEFLDAGAVPLLVKAVSDSDAGVRVAALGAIRRVNNGAAAAAVTTALGDSDVGVRSAALDAAMHLGGFSDATTVTGMLGDADPTIRAKACNALALFRTAGAVSGLEAIVRGDSDEAARIAAANALGEIGDVSARDTLTAAAANDASTRVKDAARIAGLKLAIAN